MLYWNVSQKICPSAGNKGRELLSIAMKDAAGDKFISYNPMPETKPYPRAKPKVRVLSKEKIESFFLKLRARILGIWKFYWDCFVGYEKEKFLD